MSKGWANMYSVYKSCNHVSSIIITIIIIMIMIIMMIRRRKCL